MNRKNAKAGRPKLSDSERRKRVTVSLRPAGDDAWSKFARKARVSKGALADWLVRSPEAAEARKLALQKARLFVPPD